MMDVLSAHDWVGDFAQSPAGWITGLLMPVLLALFLRKSSRDSQFRDRVWSELRSLNGAQAEQTRALSVLVTHVEHERADVARVPALEREVAVLHERVDALKARLQAGGGS